MEKERKRFTMIRNSVAAILLVLIALFGCFGCKKSTPNGPRSLSVMDDFKREYFVGEELDPTGTLKVYYQTDYFGVTPITAKMVSGFDSSKQGDCTVKITFAGKSVDVLLRIYPMLATAISLNTETLPRVVYRGEGFPSGATLNATMVNGAARDNVPITAEMLGGFDSMRLGMQNVTVTFAGVSAVFSLTVKEDSIQSISLTGAKSEYSVGEALSTENAKVKLRYESGKEELRTLTKEMVGGFSTELGGSFSAKVTYLTFTCDYYYSVGKSAVSAILVEGTLPAVLEKGSAFPEGGVVRVTYNDQTTSDIPASAGAISGFDTSAAGSFEAAIVVQGQTVRYAYSVLKGVSQGMPIGYTEAVQLGSAFDGFGVIAFVYEDGETENVPMTDERVALHYDTSEAGKIRQTATFRGADYEFFVTVYTPEERNAVEEISLIGSFKSIVLGEEPDVGGVSISVRYKYLEPTTVALEKSMMTFDPPDEIEGDNEECPIEIALLGKTIMTSITLLSPSYAARATYIAVYGLPSIVLTGSAPDYSQAGLIVHYGGGYRTESGVALANAEVTGYDTSSPGEITLSIEYQGATCSAKILVIAAEDKDKPTDATLLNFAPVLFEGEDLSVLDLSQSSVSITLGYGFSQTTIPLDASMLSGGSFEEAGQTTILFRYEGLEKEVGVTVHPTAEKTEITAISAEQIRSTVGVYPDLSKAPLTLEYGYGRRYIYIPLSSAGIEISPFSVDKVGIVVVSITYQGKTCSCLMSFAAAGGEAVVEKIAIDDSSVKTFEKGSALTGVVLTVSYASGESAHVNVTAEMIPEFSTEKSGDFAVTVAYGGKSAVFAYHVE